jgi:hypothetical protein
MESLPDRHCSGIAIKQAGNGKAWSPSGYVSDTNLEVLSMSAFPPFDDKRKLSETWMVRLECLGDIPGPRFLDGHTQDGKVALTSNPDDPHFSGTSWAVTTLAPDVVKFRCMGFAQAPNSKPTPRFLAGSNHEDSVGMRPMLANPPSAEWWRFVELSDGSVTLECLNRHADPNRRFLNGSTGDGRAGLAPNTAPPFTGTRWRVHLQGKLVVMECQGKIPGNKFLDGNSAANATISPRGTRRGPCSKTRPGVKSSQWN